MVVLLGLQICEVSDGCYSANEQGGDVDQAFYYWRLGPNANTLWFHELWANWNICKSSCCSRIEGSFWMALWFLGQTWELLCSTHCRTPYHGTMRFLARTSIPNSARTPSFSLKGITLWTHWIERSFTSNYTRWDVGKLNQMIWQAFFTMP